MTLPWIGITTYERNAQDDFVLPAVYVDAVRRAGGIPVLLPPGDPHRVEIVSRLDGMIFSGGLDVDIVHYGGTPHPQIEMHNAERDDFELQMIHQILEQRLPTLCICRGMQVLNVALGGSLIEHVPEVVGVQVLHQTSDLGQPIAHSVHVLPGSRLATIVQTPSMIPMSWHHQALRQVAPSLVAVAWAEDGIVEAVEMSDPDHPWLLGVQWHPELSAARDPRQQAFFHALVMAAQS